MKKNAIIFFMLFATLLFALGCTSSLSPKVPEADLFCDNKYEDRDVEDPYAEERSNLEGTLAPALLFSPLMNPFFEFLPGLFSPNTHLVGTLSILRC